MVPPGYILSGGTVPPGCVLYGGTVPPVCVLSGGTVPPGCVLSGGTVPPFNLSLIDLQIMYITDIYILNQCLLYFMTNLTYVDMLKFDVTSMWEDIIYTLGSCQEDTVNDARKL